MKKRFVCIWFHHLKTDWAIRHKELSGLGERQNLPFVMAEKSHGRLIITASNKLAEIHGIHNGMTVADARAFIKNLVVIDDKPDLEKRILKGLAEWSIRFSPIVSTDVPDGITIDASGCAHLWGSEQDYIKQISKRLSEIGYQTRISMADTIGCAWAIARFGKISSIIESGKELESLLPLPSAALRIEENHIERLNKLGLRKIGDFIAMPRASLRRRFGEHLITRMNQAIGYEDEIIQPVVSKDPFEDRLHSIEPISTRKGIEIALEKLIQSICSILNKDGKGIRKCIFRGYRTDGKTESMQIETNNASANVSHIYKLFELGIDKFAPGPGIELFSIHVPIFDDVVNHQEKMWATGRGLEDQNLSRLLDTISRKYGKESIKRFLPDEHYWPERSIKIAQQLNERSTSDWKVYRPRPVQLLKDPKRIEVMAPVPDYPPMQFKYENKLHKISRADGPERIEQEWWIRQGEHRDYYYVEDEEGKRYWIFRSGHYTGDKTHQWFIHGFFA